MEQQLAFRVLSPDHNLTLLRLGGSQVWADTVGWVISVMVETSPPCKILQTNGDGRWRLGRTCLAWTSLWSFLCLLAYSKRKVNSWSQNNHNFVNFFAQLEKKFMNRYKEKSKILHPQ